MLHFVLHNIDTKIISGCFHLLARQTSTATSCDL